jgi:hypothetical protein
MAFEVIEQLLVQNPHPLIIRAGRIAYSEFYDYCEQERTLRSTPNGFKPWYKGIPVCFDCCLTPEQVLLSGQFRSLKRPQGDQHAAG